MIIVTGCESNSIKSSSGFCALYKPVPTLYEGTELQRLRIDQNNATFMELRCMEDRNGSH